MWPRRTGSQVPRLSREESRAGFQTVYGAGGAGVTNEEEVAQLHRVGWGGEVVWSLVDDV